MTYLQYTAQMFRYFHWLEFTLMCTQSRLSLRKEISKPELPKTSQRELKQFGALGKRRKGGPCDEVYHYLGFVVYT